jgi:hypothetical protein
MNERIDELLWQAGGYTKLSYPDDTFLDGRYALTQEQLEKFAELIVRECAQVSEDDITDGDACCTNTAYRISRQIKEHFGVEEW